MYNHHRRVNKKYHKRYRLRPWMAKDETDDEHGSGSDPQCEQDPFVIVMNRWLCCRLIAGLFWLWLCFRRWLLRRLPFNLILVFCRIQNFGKLLIEL